jgi:hypothetical protein
MRQCLPTPQYVMCRMFIQCLKVIIFAKEAVYY